MASRKLAVVREDALALSPDERACLARDLLASLDGSPDPDAAAAWDEEIIRRIDQIENGDAVLLDGGETIAAIRRRITPTS